MIVRSTYYDKQKILRIFEIIRFTGFIGIQLWGSFGQMTFLRPSGPSRWPFAMNSFSFALPSCSFVILSKFSCQLLILAHSMHESLSPMKVHFIRILQSRSMHMTNYIINPQKKIISFWVNFSRLKSWDTVSRRLKLASSGGRVHSATLVCRLRKKAVGPSKR